MKYDTMEWNRIYDRTVRCEIDKEQQRSSWVKSITNSTSHRLIIESILFRFVSFQRGLLITSNSNIYLIESEWLWFVMYEFWYLRYNTSACVPLLLFVASSSTFALQILASLSKKWAKWPPPNWKSFITIDSVILLVHFHISRETTRLFCKGRKRFL